VAIAPLVDVALVLLCSLAIDTCEQVRFRARDSREPLRFCARDDARDRQLLF